MTHEIQQTITGNVSAKYLIETDRDRTVNFTFTHDQPNTSSNISICVLASGAARVQVSATIIITPSAQDTNAWLEIKVITIGQATVSAAPNLEIACHAVRAGHALSTKHVSDDELFYLASRGLDCTEAEQLIINALVTPYRKGIIL